MDRHQPVHRGRSVCGDTGGVPTFDEIMQTVADGESESVEFKATTGQRTEAARTLSAMLNGNGGQVIFGVQPTGKITGQQVGAKTLEDITTACSDIHPANPPSIERVPIPGGHQRHLIVVTVPAGRSRPYTFKGRHYQRSGAATVGMPEEVQLALVMQRAHSTARWELEPARRGLEDLDADEVRAFRDEARSAHRAQFDPEASVPDVLRAMNLLDAEGAPNRGAVALFGLADSFGGEFPTLGCRMVAVAGTHLTDPYRHDELLEGNVFTCLRRAMGFCEDHLHHPSRINGLQAEVRLEIPREAVREALANAFAHRDYRVAGLVQVHIFYDRLEVWSPGALPFGLRPADLYLPHSSSPWNPHILGCLYRRGIVEQLGSGTLRMVRLCREDELGRPLFTELGASVRCSIPRSGYFIASDGSAVAIGALEAVVLAALAEGPKARGELTRRAGVAALEMRDVLGHLREAGIVRVEGRARAARWMLDSG